MIDKNTSNIVNFLRWIAALLVLFNHTRYLILVNFNEVVNKTIFTKGLYFITGFGHEAVVLFFVISGFLVGGISYQKWSIDINHKKYLLDRFSRIYVVLTPALVIGGILDFLGLNYFNDAELYTNSAQYHTNSLASIITDKFTIDTFFYNLLMLQGKVTSTFGSNNPLWSLSYEWWYYVSFMLIYSLFKEKKLTLIIPITIIIFLVPLKTIVWGSIWVLGIFITPVASILKRIKFASVIFSILFVLAICISRLSHNTDNAINPEPLYISYLRDLFLGVACTLFIACVGTIKKELPFSRINKNLANFSYSTYLFHFPVLILSTSFLYQEYGAMFQIQPNLNGCIYFLTLSIFMYLYTYIFYLLFERNTGKIRQKLEKYTI